MNIVTATFSAGCTQIDADRKLWQYDQGQILQLVGLELPDAYQVEFSNSRDKGSAKAQIGGPDGVQIPDEYLTTGKPVYAFLVGHTAEEDRETEKLVVIYVNARSQPTDEPITPEQQTIVDQLIAALTAGVAKAEDAAAQAEAAISYMPKIVDGTWWVYDAETETWADTGIQAEGQDGVGISGAVLNADYTLTLTFSDGTSYTTPSIRGPKGEDAPTDYILVQPTQPTSPTNRLWVDSDRGSTVQLPTMADHQALAGAVADNTEAIGDLSDELADQKSAIENLQALTNRKAGMLVDTASGAIASFVPDASVENLLGLTVGIEPVQDLHGFDHPWPGGGGKNKFGCADGSYAIGSTRTAIVTNGVWSYKVNSAATSSVFLPEATVTAMNIPALKAGTYTFSLASNAAVSSIIAAAVLNLSDGQAITNGNSFTISADTSVVSITTPSSGEYAVGTYTCNIQIESGSTATAWTPYSNECPISGWDSVDIWNKPTHDTTADPTVTIQLGQTVYGTKLTIAEDGSVTALVDRVMPSLAGAKLYRDNVTHKIWAKPLDYISPNSAGGNAISNITNIFGIVSSTAPVTKIQFPYGTQHSLFASIPADYDIADVQACYELAEPITIQLDPVTISAISGQTNNVWSDAGDVRVEFAADLKTYIDNKIAAAVAALS